MILKWTSLRGVSAMQRCKQTLLFILLVATALPSEAWARQEILQFLNKKTYGYAKSWMIKSGFVPVKFRHPEPISPCPGDQSCDLYPELLDCSGTGLAFCEFVFFSPSHRRHVVIVTYGEVRARVHEVYYPTREDMSYWDPETH